MNYRHAYHAGNFADVMKHAIVALLVERLKAKEAPFAVLDTHAGTGLYDLGSDQAERTGEWREGIGLLAAAADPPAEAAPYLGAVRALNEDGGLRFYPGSPELVRTLLRAHDRLMAVELHPEDWAALRRRFDVDARVGIHHMDGYAALKALLPPRPEKRGLVLIDPPFEARDEFERLGRALAGAAGRWPTGLFAAWYPIKARGAVDRFLAELAMAGLPRTLAAELQVHPGGDPARLSGTGMVLVNPPWKLDEALSTLLPWLAGVLAPGRGTWRLDWIIPPA